MTEKLIHAFVWFIIATVSTTVFVGVLSAIVMLTMTIVTTLVGVDTFTWTQCVIVGLMSCLFLEVSFDAKTVI